MTFRESISGFPATSGVAMAEIMRGGRVTFGRQSSLAPEDKLVPADAEPLKSAKDLETVAELLYCACKGDVEGVDALLAKGLSPDATDFDSRTALHLAACEGHLDVVQFLINKGADVNRADRWGSTVCCPHSCPPCHLCCCC